MRPEDWHPSQPRRMARLGLLTTLVLSPLVLLDVSQQTTNADWATVVGGLSVALLASLLVLGVATARGRSAGHTVIFYVWGVLAVAALGSIASASGGDPRRYGVLFGLAIALFAINFPTRGQLVLQPVTLLSFAGVLLASDLDAAAVGVQLGVATTLSLLAVEASVRLRSSDRAAEEARTQATHQAGLAAALSRLTSLDHEELLARIVDAIVELGFEVATVSVLEDGYLVPAQHRGLSTVAAPYAIPADRGLAGRAVAERRTIAVGDYLEFEARLPDRDGVRSAVAVPLVVDDECVGVLIGARPVPGMPSSSEVHVLEVLATHAGHAIDNARRFASEQRTVARLTELEAMKSSFVSNVSHELRTPLTVIHGVGETLAMHGEELDAERRRDLLARLNANSERLGAMIAALLDFSRFEAGAAEVSPAPVALQPAIAAVLARMEPMFARHDVSDDVADATVLVDPRLFEHVIENLVGNALRHTPPGTRVEVRAVRAGELARVSVTDSGPGIAADELEHLTERFYRGGPTSRASSGGVGLGLALCEQILAAHGTSLVVRSEVGVGSEFSFVLPLVIAAPVVSGSR